MEGLYLPKQLVKIGDWMIKIDLKDAYFTVPVSKQHQSGSILAGAGGGRPGGGRIYNYISRYSFYGAGVW